jgi:hypothetical protein
MQKRKHSILEILASTAIGFAISLSALYFIFPFFGIESTHSKNIGITVFFTVISIIRGYFVRRFFNKKVTVFTLDDLKTMRAAVISAIERSTFPSKYHAALVNILKKINGKISSDL